MMTPAEVKAQIVANLQSPYLFAIQMTLTKLMARVHFGGDNPDPTQNLQQYRISYLGTDGVTVNYVKTIDDLIAGLDETKFDFQLYLAKKDPSYITPITVRLTNFTLDVNTLAEDDRALGDLFGIGLKDIQFVMTYLADLDTNLPLKIVDVKFPAKLT